MALRSRLLFSDNDLIATPCLRLVCKRVAMGFKLEILLYGNISEYYWTAGCFSIIYLFIFICWFYILLHSTLNYRFVWSFSQLVHGGLVVSVLDCQSIGSGFKSRPGQKFGSRFLLHLCPLAYSAMTVHCLWEDETARERTGHLPVYAEVANTSYLWLP